MTRIKILGQQTRINPTYSNNVKDSCLTLRYVMHKKYYKTSNGCRKAYVLQRFQLFNATLLHCLENSLKILQRGVLLSLDTNGFLLQPLYSSDIFRRNLILNLIPFSMTTWGLLNFLEFQRFDKNYFLVIDFKKFRLKHPSWWLYK